MGAEEEGAAAEDGACATGASVAPSGMVTRAAGLLHAAIAKRATHERSAIRATRRIDASIPLASAGAPPASRASGLELSPCGRRFLERRAAVAVKRGRGRIVVD